VTLPEKTCLSASRSNYLSFQIEARFIHQLHDFRALLKLWPPDFSL
jgi:hypothetical protein